MGLLHSVQRFILLTVASDWAWSQKVEWLQVEASSSVHQSTNHRENHRERRDMEREACGKYCAIWLGIELWTACRRIQELGNRYQQATIPHLLTLIDTHFEHWAIEWTAYFILSYHYLHLSLLILILQSNRGSLLVLGAVPKSVICFILVFNAWNKCSKVVMDQLCTNKQTVARKITYSTWFV